MKTQFILSTVLSLFISLAAYSQSSFYDFKVNAIDGSPFDLSTLKGKKVLVVNTASKCGLTPQYADLEKLYKEYAEKGLVVIGFPDNDFLSQEPGTNEEIQTFCSVNYGVTFPMMEKISVKGKEIHPLYAWLTSKDKNGVMDSEVKWNFQKYMIDENGVLVDVAFPKDEPYGAKIINWLEGIK